jgi:hypothetical protein
MEMHKNNYTKEEDPMLWEIHEIRHKLQEEYQHLSVKEINARGIKILEAWKLQNRMVAPFAKSRD